MKQLFSSRTGLWKYYSKSNVMHKIMKLNQQLDDIEWHDIDTQLGNNVSSR